jgi:hypothetical protein
VSTQRKFFTRIGYIAYHQIAIERKQENVHFTYINGKVADGGGTSAATDGMGPIRMSSLFFTSSMRDPNDRRCSVPVTIHAMSSLFHLMRDKQGPPAALSG